METEIIVPINGFEGRYYISSFGRIFTTYQRMRTRHNTALVLNGVTVFELRQSLVERYPHIALVRNDGVRMNYFTHKLVALHFLESPVQIKNLVVNHKDGNRSNNRCDNLEWVSQSENIRHAYRTGLAYGPKGEKNGISKLRTCDVLEIKKMISDKVLKQSEIAKTFGVSPQVICDIKKRRKWAHIEG